MFKEVIYENKKIYIDSPCWSPDAYQLFLDALK